MEPIVMDCASCDSGTGFTAHYCSECGRWTFHVEKRHALMAVALMAGTAVAVGLVILQPELIPLVGGAIALAKRAAPLLA
ncbi:MAG TPA: hypothetical protein VEJ86_07140 [Candidatus Binataceae bacterium]|nr:hypothetical protein [Candidatus Binataceae bacterium]